MRVLEIIVPLGNGGVEQMIKYWVRDLVSETLHIDIATPRILDVKNKQYLEELGCRIYVIPFRQRKMVRRYATFYNLIQRNEYDIVHVHTNSSLDFVSLLAAKNNGVKIRIGHSHASALGNPSRISKMINQLLKPVFYRLCTKQLACSEKAGEYLFGTRAFELCRNGIDTEKYSFSLQERNNIRADLGIENKKVLGAVANFMPEKNHTFMIKIFAELSKEGADYVLLLIGSGSLLEVIKEKVKSCGLNEKVLFEGNRHDAYRYYSAMDGYLLCSHNEGFAVSALEAQCSGLPLFIGNNLSMEMRVLPNTYSVKPYDDIKAWKNTIQEVMYNSVEDREKYGNLLKEKGYDINDTVINIKKEYQR